MSNLQMIEDKIETLRKLYSNLPEDFEYDSRKERELNQILLDKTQKSEEIKSEYITQMKAIERTYEEIDQLLKDLRVLRQQQKR